MNPENNDKDIRDKEIREGVSNYRKLKNITPTPGSKREGSCEAYPGGEFANLVECQLAHTIEGQGDWYSLNNEEVKVGTHEYLKKINFYKSGGPR